MLTILLAGLSLVAADTVTTDHYRLYSGTGDSLAWEEIQQQIATADVVLIGENHDDPVAHHIEVRVLREALADTARTTTASLEMFTRDVQPVIDEYLAGLITERHFRAESRPWSNYETDYRPFVEAAREAGRPVIAANAPRRYVNRVTRLGPAALLDLSGFARRWLAPLPYEPASAAYRAEWDALMAEAMAGMAATMDSTAATEDSTEAAGGHGGGYAAMGYALDAQALWDATMAYSIVDHLTRNPGDQVIHIVGSFHVRNGTGIPEHIQHYRPGTSVVIIVVEPAEDIDAFDADQHQGLGDIVVLGDESLPRTYEPGSR